MLGYKILWSFELFGSWKTHFRIADKGFWVFNSPTSRDICQWNKLPLATFWKRDGDRVRESDRQ